MSIYLIRARYCDTLLLDTKCKGDWNNMRETTLQAVGSSSIMLVLLFMFLYYLYTDDYLILALTLIVLFTLLFWGDCYDWKLKYIDWFYSSNGGCNFIYNSNEINTRRGKICLKYLAIAMYIIS